jgi:RimJ/RimL family protein N-acetyltransferase
MRHVREIETDRLKLRRLCVADGARISQWTSDPGVARMVTRIPLPHPVVAAEGYVLITRAREPLGEDHVFAVDLRDEGLIGVIGAHLNPKGAFQLGYWYGRPFWGRGYASEALAAFLSEADGLGALESHHFVDNPASGRVLEKAGFAYTGEKALKFSMARGHSVQSHLMVRPAVRQCDGARCAAHA